jgi:hypothetical protein
MRSRIRYIWASRIRGCDLKYLPFGHQQNLFAFVITFYQQCVFKKNVPVNRRWVGYESVKSASGSIKKYYGSRTLDYLQVKAAPKPYCSRPTACTKKLPNYISSANKNYLY